MMAATPEDERLAASDPSPSGTAGSDPDDGFACMLVGARAGKPAASRDLYESLAGRVCGYLRLRGANDPEDLTSEVFLRVFNHLDDFTGDARGFAAWVFTIARRALIDERIRDTRRPSTVELTDSTPAMISGSQPEADALEGIARDDLLALLDRLTPDQRDVLALRIVADLPIRQVASVLHKSPGTVKALQHRGVAALRRHLEGNPR
jgi:RNA polymerase sigma factor (sigma-70 family)